MPDTDTLDKGTVTSFGDQAKFIPVEEGAAKAKPVTLSQVEEAQEKLLKLIEAVDATDKNGKPIKDALKQRIVKDDKVIRDASNDALNDDKSNTPLDSQESKNDKGKFVPSTGLKDHQAKTETKFKELLKGKEKENKNEEVFNQLAQLNALRAQLFAQEYNKELNKTIEDGKAALDDLLDGGLFRLRGAKVTAVGPGEKAKTLAEELGTDQKVFSKDGKIWVHIGTTEDLDQYGNPTGKTKPSIDSNDPVALGKAIAANGWDTATINSEDVDFAIKAAAAAIQHGVKNVKLHPNVWKKLNDTQNADQYFNSYHEQEVFRNRAKAVLRMSENKNSIFNAQKQTYAEKFVQAPSEIQADMVNVLNAKQQAQLAWDLKKNNFAVKDGAGRPQEPTKFIKNLVAVKEQKAAGLINKIFNSYRYVNNKTETHAAKEKYTKELYSVIANDYFDNHIKNMNDPKEMAKAITKSAEAATQDNALDLSSSRIARRLARKLDELPQHLKNEAKAAYMSELFDKALTQHKANPKSYQAKNLDRDLRSLLNGLDDEDKINIQSIFAKNYDRVENLQGKAINNDSPNKDGLVDATNSDLYNEMKLMALKHLDFNYKPVGLTPAEQEEEAKELAKAKAEAEAKAKVEAEPKAEAEAKEIIKETPMDRTENADDKKPRVEEINEDDKDDLTRRDKTPKRESSTLIPKESKNTSAEERVIKFGPPWAEQNSKKEPKVEPAKKTSTDDNKDTESNEEEINISGPPTFK